MNKLKNYKENNKNNIKRKNVLKNAAKYVLNAGLLFIILQFSLSVMPYLPSFAFLLILIVSFMFLLSGGLFQDNIFNFNGVINSFKNLIKLLLKPYKKRIKTEEFKKEDKNEFIEDIVQNKQKENKFKQDKNGGLKLNKISFFKGAKNKTENIIYDEKNKTRLIEKFREIIKNGGTIYDISKKFNLSSSDIIKLLEDDENILFSKKETSSGLTKEKDDLTVPFEFSFEKEIIKADIDDISLLCDTEDEIFYLKDVDNKIYPISAQDLYSGFIYTFFLDLKEACKNKTFKYKTTFADKMW